MFNTYHAAHLHAPKRAVRSATIAVRAAKPRSR
jgi:hypothetical protein